MKARPALPRRLGRLVAVPAVAYAGIAGMVAGCQRHLIYHPSHPAPAEVSRHVLEAGLVPWTNPRGEAIGWHRPHPVAPGKARVLITHGNAGSAVGRAYLADPLQAGWQADVFILEYPGFGNRPGSPSQDSLLAAARDAVDALAGPVPLYLVGESLGTGVAAGVAAERPDRIAGILLLTPFDSLTHAAGHHYPWLPVSWLIRDPYPSADWLGSYPGPVGVVVGGADSIVPARLGRNLHAGLPGRKRLWDFPGQEHWEASQQPPEWWSEAAAFLAETDPESDEPSHRNP